MAFCSECGNAIDEGAKFCNGCGTNLEGAAEVTPPTCEQCGAELAEGTKFCSGCGARSALADAQPVVPAVREQVQPLANPRTAGQIECPYCHGVGTVVVQKVKKKKGVSTGKATAALLTAGISLIGTGLAKKEVVSQLTCAACNMTWEA